MKTEWPQLPITDLFRLKQGTYLKKEEMVEVPDSENPFPVYGANGIIGYSRKKMYPERTTLVSCRGANCGVVHYTAKNSWISNNSIALVPRADIDPTFYYYLSLSTSFEDVVTGSAQPQITITNLSSKTFVKPPLPTQRKIAGILSAYDDLIENNLRRIKILEEMAQSLYREWFVHFRFPGHESAQFIDSELGQIPKGWQVTDLENVTSKIGSGATPRGGKDNYKTEGISLIRSLNIYDYNFDFDNLAFIDEGQASQLDNVTVQAGDVLLNITGASVCRCAMVPSYLLPARVNQHVAIIRADAKVMDQHYLLDSINSTRNKQKLFNLAQGGATREALTKETICRFPLLLPPPDLLFRYGSIAGPLHKQRESLHRRNQTLRRTRDLLLPKLLSGDQP